MGNWWLFCPRSGTYDDLVCFFAIIAIIAFAGNSNLKSIPEGLQNLTEYITEFIRDLAKTQIGEEEYVKWVPF
jgi:F-type H+-transporting ATPase subunit a